MTLENTQNHVVNVTYIRGKGFHSGRGTPGDLQCQRTAHGEVSKSRGHKILHAGSFCWGCVLGQGDPTRTPSWSTAPGFPLLTVPAHLLPNQLSGSPQELRDGPVASWVGTGGSGSPVTVGCVCTQQDASLRSRFGGRGGHRILRGAVGEAALSKCTGRKGSGMVVPVVPKQMLGDDREISAPCTPSCCRWDQLWASAFNPNQHFSR